MQKEKCRYIGLEPREYRNPGITAEALLAAGYWYGENRTMQNEGSFYKTVYGDDNKKSHQVEIRTWDFRKNGLNIHMDVELCLHDHFGDLRVTFSVDNGDITEVEKRCWHYVKTLGHKRTDTENAE